MTAPRIPPQPALALLRNSIVGNGHRASRYARMNPQSHDAKYTTVHEALTDAQLAEHLAGCATYAAILIGSDGLVSAALIELDQDCLDGARRVQAAAAQRGVTLFSIVVKGAGDHDGSHNWALFAERVAPQAAAHLMRQIASEADYADVEIWPKGNAIRLPFGVHTHTQLRGRLLLPSGEVFNLDDAEQLAAGSAAVVALPLNQPPAAPLVVERVPVERTYIQPSGEAQDHESVIDAFNRRYSMAQVVEMCGGSQTKDGWACNCGHQHSHATNLLITDRDLLLAYGPNCGWAPERLPGAHAQTRFGLYATALHHGDIKAAVKAAAQLLDMAHRPGAKVPPRQEPTPHYTAVQATAYKAAQREQRVVENCQVLTRLAEQLGELELSDRATALAGYLISLACDAGVLQVRPSNPELAKAMRFCERSVQYAFRELECAGVGKRQGGRGGLDRHNQRATWTFFRSLSPRRRCCLAEHPLPSLGCNAEVRDVANPLPSLGCNAPNPLPSLGCNGGNGVSAEAGEIPLSDAECTLVIYKRDLKEKHVLASERGPSSHAHARVGDPAAAWELFAPASDDGHSAAELNALERDTNEWGRQPADQAPPLTSPSSLAAEPAQPEQPIAAPATIAQRIQLRAVRVLGPDADEPALLTSPSSLAAELAQQEQQPAAPAVLAQLAQIRAVLTDAEPGKPQQQLDHIRALLGIKPASDTARLEEICAILALDSEPPAGKPADEQRPAHQPEQPELSDNALIVQDYYASGSDIPIADALAWLSEAEIAAAIDELQRASGIAATPATPSHRDLLTAVRSRAREVNEPGWTQRDYDEYDRASLQQELKRLEQLLAADEVAASEPITRPWLLHAPPDCPAGRVSQSGPRWCAWRGDNATWHMTETEARIVAGLDVPAPTCNQSSRPADQQRPAHQPEQPELSDNALIVQDYFASASNTPIADALGWLTAAEIAAAVEELRRSHHQADAEPATEAQRLQSLPPEALNSTHWRKPSFRDDDQPDGASYDPAADWTAQAGPAVERHYERGVRPREAYTKVHGWRDIWANMQRRDVPAADEPATEPLDWSESEAETLVLAPPLETSPAYREFAWRWNAARQGSRSPAQRAKFKRDATALLEAVAPIESVRRWELFERLSPKTRVCSVAEVVSPTQSTPSESPAFPLADQASSTQQADLWELVVSTECDAQHQDAIEV